MREKIICLLIIALWLVLAPQAQAQEPREPMRDSVPAHQPPTAGVQSGSAAHMRFLPQAPRTLTLCGEKVPLDDPFIYEQLDREFNSLVHDQGQIVMCLKRAGRYFPYISRELKAAGLPDDLKYLAVTESFLLHYVRSGAGALGLWQFMPATGKRFNLEINSTLDERLNPEKTTHAAIAYFNHLHRMFKNWALVMAAYNCGEGKVSSELKEQGAKSYYELYLARETMRYVYRIMALKIIMSNPEAYGYYLPAEQIYQPIQGDRITITLDGPTPLRDIAAYSKTSVRYLRELNPELLTNTLPKGSYQLVIVKGQGANVLRQIKQAQANSASRPRQASQAAREWVVKPGDTLTNVAKRFGVSVQTIKDANNLASNNIRIGQKLIIP